MGQFVSSVAPPPNTMCSPCWLVLNQDTSWLTRANMCGSATVVTPTAIHLLYLLGAWALVWELLLSPHERCWIDMYDSWTKICPYDIDFPIQQRFAHTMAHQTRRFRLCFGPVTVTIVAVALMRPSLMCCPIGELRSPRFMSTPGGSVLSPQKALTLSTASGPSATASDSLSTVTDCTFLGFPSFFGLHYFFFSISPSF